jgi:subtilisin family serine protease
LAAPGVNIYTAQLNGGYGKSSGTSLSTAYISGTAAMAQIAFPSLSEINIKSRIMASVDKRNQFSNKVVARGRLNAHNIFDLYAANQLPADQISSVDREQRIRDAARDRSGERPDIPQSDRSRIANTPELDIVANHIMMSFTDTYKGYSLEERTALLAPFGVNIEKDFPYAGGAVLLTIKGAPSAPAGRLPEGETKESVYERVNNIIEQLQESGLVEYAEPDGIVRSTATPNDTRYDELWGLETIQAEQAVDYLERNNTAPTEVIIAIIDTGIDYNHPDLIDNMWVNTGEIAGDDIDNDNNGYVDDVYGINAINNTGDPMDDHSHGTHVAGTIGAIRNNNLGVAGVTPHVRLMALKFLAANNFGFTSDAVQLLDYVHMMKQEKGVDVKLTNNSWGGTSESQSLQAAIEASNQYNILFVAAAGNDGENLDSFSQYPANYDIDNIISVAATNSSDNLSSFSNYGSEVDLAAPGSSILSTTLDDTYGFKSGTSMAAPHVSGALGLLFSNEPSLAIADAKSLIVDSGDTLASLNGLTRSSKRLNVYNAIAEASIVEIDLAGSSVVVDEGGSVTIDVRLNTQPEPLNTSVVTIEKTSGDDAIILSSPATLFFDDSNWDIWQSVTFSSIGDLDISNDSAVFAISALGSRARSLTVNEQDNGQLPDNICEAVSQIPEVECAALVTLYEATDGANWTNNDGWLSTNTPCSWSGIICSLDGHVSNIWLGSNNLQGVIPGVLGAFTKLQYLSLYSNNLSGSINPLLGDLTDLRYLWLSSNQLTGTIPSEIGNLLQLEGLYLSGNLLTGVIPNSIGDMSNLISLNLGSNELTGDIPEELFGLLQLQSVYLSDNQLTGSLSEAIGNLSNITTFDVGFNQISGSIPSSLSSLGNLEFFYAESNQLTGVIPSDIGNANQLSNLYLSYNQLTGEIPDSLYTLTDLTGIYLNNNQLSGELSSAIGSLSKVSAINISNNQFAGALPNELGDLSSIYNIDVSYNQLTGAIPSTLGDLGSLSYLNLSHNQLSGSIPSEIANLNGIFDLWLNDNQLTGSITAEIGTMTQLFSVNLDNNLLSGSIPAELGNLTNLFDLYLHNNQLTGTIPVELGDLVNLYYLYLQGNQLTGSIPSELSNLSNAYRLFLDNNQLTGSIPPEFGAMANLYRLYLHNNRLSGEIPPELEDSSTLSRLLVSNNQLSGTISEAISELYIVELSYNALEAANETVIANLDIADPGWKFTQTIAPENVKAVINNGELTLTWTPIDYVADEGGYIISYSSFAEGPFTEHGRVIGKPSDSYVVSDAASFSSRFYTVQSHTSAHTNQKNNVVSNYSAAVWTGYNVDPIITFPSPLILDAYSADGFTAVHPFINDFLFAATAIDKDGNIIYITHNAPSIFPVGTTEVTFEACDADDNCSTVTQTVTVDYDPVAPAPMITAPVNLTAEASGEVTAVNLGSATAIDVVDGSLVATPSQTGPFLIGTHQIIWTAINSEGKTTVAEQTVTVQDTIAPVLTLPANVVAIGRIDFEIGVATATDIFTTTVSSDIPTIYPFGVTTIIWTATDANGNESTAEQTVTLNPYYANHSRQIACEKGEDGDTIWAIDADNDSVSMINVSRNPITSERIVEVKNDFFMFTDTKPSSITRVNNYVATTYADAGSIRFNQVDFRWVDGGTVPWTTWKISLRNEMPIASVAHDNMLYVALYATGEVMKIDTATRQIVSKLKVGPKPKAMALTSDGSRLLVTRFISTADYGEVYDINTAGNMSFRDALRPSIKINKVWVPDDIDHGTGVANYLRSIVIDPSDQFAYVSANKANIERGEYLSGTPLSADNTVRSMVAVLDLTSHSDTNVDGLTRDDTTDLQNAADPSGLTFLPDGDTGVYALQGNNRIALYDFATEATLPINVGGAPQSLCVTEDRLYVNNYTDRTVSVIDVDDYINTGNTALTSEPIVIVAPEDDVLSTDELRGLQLFYSANQTELSPEGYMSCASCHDDGGHDGMTWDFTHMGEGLRNTLSLRGTSGTRFGPLNWSGSADEVQDIEKQLEQLHGSNGLIPGVTFTGQSALDHTTEIYSADLDALSAYVSSLGKDSVMKSPNYCAWGDQECWSTYYSGSWQYYSHGCGDCHTRESYSSGVFRDGLIHDVGTITETSGLGSGVPLTGIRTPTLMELWDTAPYLHDGSAETLEDVMSTGAHATYGLDEREMRNLIQFLNNVDRTQYINDESL